MPKAVSRSGKKVAFGDVVRLSRERSNDPQADGFERFVGLEHIDPGDLHIRRWGDIADGVTFTNVFRPGQLLFGKRRAYQRKVAVADFSGVCSSDIYVLEPRDERLLPDLLPFICQTDAFFEHAVGTSAGSLSPRTNWENLASYEFALPPTEEQRRICRVLTAAEAACAAFVELAKATEQAQAAMSAELLRSAKPSEIVPLGKAAKEDIRKIEVSKEAAYRTVGVLNGGQGLFQKEPLKGADTQYTHLIVLRRNQLVMRKLTAWEGAIAVVPEEFDGAVVSTEFPTVTLDEERLLPGYMAWMITQPVFWREMKARSKGTALRRSRLHQRDLLTIPIWMPCIGQQEEVVRQLSAIREAANAANRRAQDARTVLTSLIERSCPVDADGSAKRRTVEAM